MAMPRLLSILGFLALFAAATLWCDEDALLGGVLDVCPVTAHGGGHDAHDASGGCMSDGCVCACLCHAPVVLLSAAPAVIALPCAAVAPPPEAPLHAAAPRGVFRPPRIA